MKKRLYHWHRRAARWMAIPVILWAVSGILHPFMANWLKPDIPYKFFPPTEHLLDTARARLPSEIFSDLEEVHQLKFCRVAGAPHYIAYTPDQVAHYRHAITGEILKNGEEVHAIEMAAAFLDQKVFTEPDVERYDSFTSHYTPINRLLPAYRIAFERDDTLEVVVHPRTGKLATYDDATRRTMRVAFNWFHTWGFLGPYDSLFRISVVTFVSVLSLSVAISGLLTLLMTRKKKGANAPGNRRVHRLLGAGVAVFYFLFGVSGLAHAAFKFRGDDSTQWVSKQRVKSSELVTLPAAAGQGFTGLSLAVIDGQPYWRISAVGAERANDSIKMSQAMTGALLPNGDEVYARELAAEFSGIEAAQAGKAELISRFRDDYGFIFRRLPVWRVNYPGQKFWQYTIDTSDAHMSMRTDTLGVIESLLFVNFHKFHFFDALSKELRDYFSVGASLSMVALVISGLVIRRSRRRA